MYVILCEKNTICHRFPNPELQAHFGMLSVIHDALCGAGNDPGSVDHSCDERMFIQRESISHSARKRDLRIFNHFHRHSTTYTKAQQLTGSALDLACIGNTMGAPSLRFLQGRVRSCRHNASVISLVHKFGCARVRGSRPCKKRKDGAPTAQMAQARIRRERCHDHSACSPNLLESLRHDHCHR